MMKWILIIIAAAIIYKLISGYKKKQLSRTKEEKPPLNESGVLVKDPICGTYVSNQSDIRVKNHDAVYCFCSYSCRDKYIAQRNNKP